MLPISLEQPQDLRSQSKPIAHPRQRIESLVTALLILTLVASFSYGVYVNRSYLATPNSAWTVGEWMINYADGYTRRGLAGELIYRASLHWSISPFTIISALTIPVLALFIFLVLIFARKRFSRNLILSPAILLAPALGNYAFRKDLLLLDIFGISLLLLAASIRHKTNPAYAALAIFCVNGITPHIHESFLFWGGPSLIASFYLASRNTKPTSLIQDKTFLWAALLCFALAANFAIIFLHHKSADPSIVNHSWQILGSRLSPSQQLVTHEPQGAIQSLAWSLHYSVSQVAELWRGGTFLAWIASLLVFANLFVGDPTSRELKLKRLILTTQFLLTVPLFCVGIDYGRWIFAILCSSLFLFGFYTWLRESGRFHEDQLKRQATTALDNVLKKVLRGFDSSGARSALFLFLGLPVCCWSLSEYIQSTPIAAIAKIFLAAFKA